MKILIAISSCQSFEDAGLNDPLRETWLPEAVKLGFDYKFFHGSSAKAKDDVIIVSTVDELYGLTEKLKAKLRWALRNEYDYVFSCFPDTYARPERLLTSGFDRCDYLGNVYQFPDSSPFAQGGPGYILSRKACEAAVSNNTAYLNDDAWLGDVLTLVGIAPMHNPDFKAFGPGPLLSNSTITNHLSTQPGGYTGDNLRADHQRWLESL